VAFYIVQARVEETQGVEVKNGRLVPLYRDGEYSTKISKKKINTGRSKIKLEKGGSVSCIKGQDCTTECSEKVCCLEFKT